MIRLTFVFCCGGAFRLFADRIAYTRRGATRAALLLLPLMFSRPLAEPAFAILGGYLIFWFAFAVRPTALSRATAQVDPSYGLYLYAWPVQNLLVARIPGISPWTVAALALAAAIPLGLLSWYLIERPMLRFRPGPGGARRSPARSRRPRPPSGPSAGTPAAAGNRRHPGAFSMDHRDAAAEAGHDAGSGSRDARPAGRPRPRPGPPHRRRSARRAARRADGRRRPGPRDAGAGGGGRERRAGGLRPPTDRAIPVSVALPAPRPGTPPVRAAEAEAGQGAAFAAPASAAPAAPEPVPDDGADAGRAVLLAGLATVLILGAVLLML